MVHLELALEKAAELIITGFEGSQLSDDTEVFLSQNKLGGVILFNLNGNYESPEQLYRLSKEIQASRKDAPLWIMVDQEGGRVQRLKKPFTKIPNASAIASQGSPKVIFDISQMIAKELRVCGVNFNLAPVVDIDEIEADFLGDRCFGTTEGVVTPAVTAFVRGHLKENVACCAKHFPGSGSIKIDPHRDLPRSNKTFDELKSKELVPFQKAIRSRVTGVMMSHILFPDIDAQHPASLSQKWIKKHLKQDLRFDGLVLADDLEMGALVKHFPADEIAWRAVQAGCDLLLYRTEDAARSGLESIRSALKSEKLSAEDVITAADRSLELKQEFATKMEIPSIEEINEIVGCQEHQDLVKPIHAAIQESKNKGSWVEQ